MRKAIEFVEAGSVPLPEANKQTQAPRWRDLTLGIEHSKLRVKFRQGKNLIRILPQMPGGTSYVEPIQVIKNDAFKAVTNPGDLFQRAYRWLWDNKRDSLFNFKTNPTGFKLKPASEAIAWVLYWDEENNIKLGLIQTAFSSGKNPGLLAEIVAAAEATELNPETQDAERIYDESIADKDKGRTITVEKTVDPNVEARYGTSYRATISSKPGCPIGQLIDKLSDEEFALLKPLPQVIKTPTEAEQKECLISLLGASLVAEIGI